LTYFKKYAYNENNKFYFLKRRRKDTVTRCIKITIFGKQISIIRILCPGSREALGREVHQPPSLTAPPADDLSPANNRPRMKRTPKLICPGHQHELAVKPGVAPRKLQAGRKL